MKGRCGMKVWEVVMVIDEQNEIGECVEAYENYMEASERAAMLNSGTDETFIVIAEFV